MYCTSSGLALSECWISKAIGACGTWREELGNPALDTSKSRGSLDDVLKPQTRNRLINEEHCYLSVLNKNENIRRGLKVFLSRWLKRRGEKNAVTAWMFRVGFPIKQLDGWTVYLKAGAGKPCAKHVNVDGEPRRRFRATRENSPVNRGALLLVGSITTCEIRDYINCILGTGGEG